MTKSRLNQLILPFNQFHRSINNKIEEDILKRLSVKDYSLYTTEIYITRGGAVTRASVYQLVCNNMSRRKPIVEVPQYTQPVGREV